MAIHCAHAPRVWFESLLQAQPDGCSGRSQCCSMLEAYQPYHKRRSSAALSSPFDRDTSNGRSVRRCLRCCTYCPARRGRRDGRFVDEESGSVVVGESEALAGSEMTSRKIRSVKGRSCRGSTIDSQDLHRSLNEPARRYAICQSRSKLSTIHRRRFVSFVVAEGRGYRQRQVLQRHGGGLVKDEVVNRFNTKGLWVDSKIDNAVREEE